MIELIRKITERIFKSKRKKFYTVKKYVYTQEVTMSKKGVEEAMKTMKTVNRKYYANRELSWLKFNKRVLEEAADMKVPLCERLSFVSIFQSNLDEFFMVRVGSLHDQMLVANDIRDNKTQMTPEEQISAVLKKTKELTKQRDGIYNRLMHQLKEHDVEIINFGKLTPEEAAYLEIYFNEEIMPLLSPQIVGKRQPFPFLKNQEIYAVVSLETKNSNEKIGIVPCSNGAFKRLIRVPSTKNRFMLVEELILHFVPQIFSHYKTKSKSLIRIIRNADIDADSALYDEDIDYRDAMAEVIKKRKKLCPVKVEFSRFMDQNIVDLVCRFLDLKKSQVFHVDAPLDVSFLFQLQDVLRDKKELFYERRIPQKSRFVDETLSMIDQIKKKDILLSYPYESMRPFIRLLEQAGQDPDVVSIKMTLYRVAKDSKIIEALIDAAENGKEVVVLVELRARFDEENNIEWSRRLEYAGCRIIYGLDGIKVHSKLCLITKKRKDGIEYITQIGTGNYNEKTSKLYTDLSLMTANPEIGMEAANVFNALAMGAVVESTEHLLVAPKCLQNKVLAMMDEQIALAKEDKPAYIGAKVNSLTDKKIIDKLVEASQAGVKVELLVRGICCLISGVEGYTDNITVISIVGRYLEHSRMYIFGAEEQHKKVYIASADYMTRNTLRRVEVATPIYDEDIKKRILKMFDTMFRDNVKVRVQDNTNNYKKRITEGEPLNSQELFYSEAYGEVTL